MKGETEKIVKKYLNVFTDEQDRLRLLEEYLEKAGEEEMTDWNNANGHLTAGAFVYCKREDKFLVLYHRGLTMYLYPGGHVDADDGSILEAAKRELKEETGLENLELLKIDNEVLPFDIDTHIIPYNERVQMPSHHHYDFRYLFLTENIDDIILDENECRDYKWVSAASLVQDENYGNIVDKVKKIL